MLEMAAYLMSAAGLRREFEESIAAGRIAVDGMRQFGDGQTAVAGDGFLRIGGRIGGSELVFVVLAAQRMIDDSGFVGVPAHDGDIGLFDLLALELRGDASADVPIEREQQHAGGAAIEAMYGMHVLSDLIAQDLHGETGLVAVEEGAVDQQSRRFVYGDQVFVAIDDREAFLH